MRRQVTLLLAAALVMSSCDTADVFLDMFAEQHKVDLRDPADVLTKKELGNENEKAALGTYAGMQQTRHWTAGDLSYKLRQWDTARAQYEKAADWSKVDAETDAGKATQASELAHLRGRVADAWLREADENARAEGGRVAQNDEAKKGFMKAVATYKNAVTQAEEAAKYARAAGKDTQPYDMQRAKFLGRAARSYYGAANDGSACSYALDALKIDPTQQQALGVKNALNCQ